MDGGDHFAGLALYNRWANMRLYEAAAVLSEQQRQRDVGVYFRSLHGTLRHLVVTDCAWMALLAGEPVRPLEEARVATFDALRTTREALDEEIAVMTAALSTKRLTETFAYTPWGGDFAGRCYSQPRHAVLTHFFNHQTHHRGQAHSALSLLGVEPPPIDLFVMQILDQGC